MGVLSSLKNAMFLNRTKYHAMIDGKEICGCGDCTNNQPFPGLIPVAPTHRCIQVMTPEESFMTIFDPFNIPNECPFKFNPEEKETEKKEE